jgi:hypothetical protein
MAAYMIIEIEVSDNGLYSGYVESHHRRRLLTPRVKEHNMGGTTRRTFLKAAALGAVPPMSRACAESCCSRT